MADQTHRGHKYSGVFDRFLFAIKENSSNEGCANAAKKNYAICASSESPVMTKLQMHPLHDTPMINGLSERIYAHCHDIHHAFLSPT